MFGRLSSRLKPSEAGHEGRRERAWGKSSRNRRQLPGVECLEHRQLLAAINEFPLPTPNGYPSGLTVGPDGNFWLAESPAFQQIGRIDRITTSGTVTEFPLNSSNGLLDQPLTVGSDGNLWFPEVNLVGSSEIGRITPSGTITDFPLTTGGTYLSQLIAGPDGNLWLGQGGNLGQTGEIVRITTSGAISEFPLLTTGIHPGTLTAGPDGNVWFTEDFPPIIAGPDPTEQPGKIGRITPSGTITEFALPADDGTPSGITAGPDGNLWFAEAGKIGRITPSGAITEFPLSAGLGLQNGLTVGPDGNLWFSDINAAGSGGIGRITTSGTITEFPLPTAGMSPGGLTAGPDGNLWFIATPSQPGLNRLIGRITPSGAITEYKLYPGPVYGAPQLTVGPDGNLWFAELNVGSIDQIVLGNLPPPPTVSGVAAVRHSGKAITSITLRFNEDLDPGTAQEFGFYSLALGVKQRHHLVFRKVARIGGVSYDSITHEVTLKLARRHYKGPVQLTISGGIMSANGASSNSVFTMVLN